MPSLAAATPFPIPADGAEPERLAREWLTDVMQTESGNEVRAAIRSVPIRRYEFTAKFGDVDGRAGYLEAQRFRTLWLTAVEPLRFIVPIWMRGTIVTAFTDPTTLVTDTRHCGFVAGGRAMLWQSETFFELVDIETVTDDGVTLVDPYEGDYVAYGASLLPVMNAWLEPPTLQLFSGTAEQLPLVFREELPAVSGIDPTVGLALVPVPASIELVLVEYGSGWTGKKYGTWEAVVKDAGGRVIPRAPVVWTIETTFEHDDALDPPTTWRTPRDGQQFRLTWENGTSTLFRLTVTIGALSAVTTIQ